MNRIDFLAWDKQSQQVLPVIDIDFSEETVRLQEDNNKSILDKFTEVDLLLYTGLSNKSGKKVYDSFYFEFKGITHFVFWSESTMSFLAKSKSATVPLAYFTGEDFTILGNSYQNPDLKKFVF